MDINTPATDTLIDAGRAKAQTLLSEHADAATAKPKNKGGRPRKDGLPPGSIPGSRPAISQAPAPTPDSDFTPDGVAGFIEGMGFLQAGLTGCSAFLVEGETAKNLGSSGARCLNRILPGKGIWLEGAYFFIGYGGLLAKQWAIYAGWKQAQKLAKPEPVRPAPASDTPESMGQDVPASGFVVPPPAKVSGAK